MQVGDAIDHAMHGDDLPDAPTSGTADSGKQQRAGAAGGVEDKHHARGGPKEVCVCLGRRAVGGGLFDASACDVWMAPGVC